MSSSAVQIKNLDPRQVTGADKVALNLFHNRISKERWPDDPMWTIQETVNNWTFVPSYLDLHQWAAWGNGGTKMVARATLYIGRAGDNQHLADFDITVLPEMRRQGVGTRMLRQVADVARSENRGLLMVSTDSAMPEGRAFVRRLGGRVGLVNRISQLDIKTLDLETVGEWRRTGQKRARGFELGFWRGAYPSQHVEAMTALKEVINAAPTDQLEIEEYKWTVEHLRQEEYSMSKRGIERWTIFARHVRTGQLVAFTELFCNSHRPQIGEQGHTAVVAEYRNRGLAKWLKSEMLHWLVSNLPQVMWVRTSNAESNTAMLAINTRIGFRPYKTSTTWQVGLDRVLKYLQLDKESHRQVVTAP